MSDAREPNENPLQPVDTPPVGGFDMGDEREHWRFWMPRYIVGLFSEQLGQRGVALYASLAWWLCSDAPHHRPTLKEIAKRAGCSRSTVWRGLKTLVEVGVIRIEEQKAITGRRAHKIVLTHPQAARDYERQFGTPVAGGTNLTPPRAQTERAEVSNCARGARNLSAPSAVNKDLSVCEPGSGTHTPDPALPENAPPPSDAEKFSENWIAALGPGTIGWRIAHRRESAAIAGALLERGWTLQELLAGIADPNRNAGEWPREFAARYTPSALKAVRGSVKAAEERQNRATAAERAREERATAAQTAAQYDALPLAERERWEREAVQLRPHTAQHPSIVRLLAIDLFASCAAGQLGGAPDAAELPTANGRATAQ